MENNFNYQPMNHRLYIKIVQTANSSLIIKPDTVDKTPDDFIEGTALLTAKILAKSKECEDYEIGDWIAFNPDAQDQFIEKKRNPDDKKPEAFCLLMQHKVVAKITPLDDKVIMTPVILPKDSKLN